jgi:hypothetical protein
MVQAMGRVCGMMCHWHRVQHLDSEIDVEVMTSQVVWLILGDLKKKGIDRKLRLIDEETQLSV